MLPNLQMLKLEEPTEAPPPTRNKEKAIAARKAKEREQQKWRQQQERQQLLLRAREEQPEREREREQERQRQRQLQELRQWQLEQPLSNASQLQFSEELGYPFRSREEWEGYLRIQAGFTQSRIVREKFFPFQRRIPIYPEAGSDEARHWGQAQGFIGEAKRLASSGRLTIEAFQAGIIEKCGPAKKKYPSRGNRTCLFMLLEDPDLAWMIEHFANQGWDLNAEAFGLYGEPTLPIHFACRFLNNLAISELMRLGVDIEDLPPPANDPPGVKSAMRGFPHFFTRMPFENLHPRDGVKFIVEDEWMGLSGTFSLQPLEIVLSHDIVYDIVPSENQVYRAENYESLNLRRQLCVQALINGTRVEDRKDLLNEPLERWLPPGFDTRSYILPKKQTPLMIAVDNHVSVQIIEILVDAGADPKQLDDNGENVLHRLLRCYPRTDAELPRSLDADLRLFEYFFTRGVYGEQQNRSGANIRSLAEIFLDWPEDSNQEDKWYLPESEAQRQKWIRSQYGKDRLLAFQKLINRRVYNEGSWFGF